MKTQTIISSLTCMLAVSAATAYRVPYGKSGTDICGDPSAQNMRDDPMKIVDYLANVDSNKYIEDKLTNHPFIKTVEDGKLTKDMMEQWIVQTAYTLQRDTRTRAAAYGMFGSDYPEKHSRTYFANGMDIGRDSLELLQDLGQKFGIDTIDKLETYDPNPVAMVFSSALAEGVMHADHHSELVAASAVFGPVLKNMLQRMKTALLTSPYKEWNLTEDDLKVFDVFMKIDQSEETDVITGILKRAIDEDVTICQMRRRLNYLNVGRLLFWDAVYGENSDGHKVWPYGPSPVSPGNVGF